MPVTAVQRCYAEHRPVEHGFSLLELALCIALFSLLGVGLWTGVDAIAGEAKIQAARLELVLLLAHARRLAYLREHPVAVTAVEGAREVSLAPEGEPASPVPLAAGLQIVAAPSRGGVTFHESGWAENATFELGWIDENHTGRQSIVVNQRGRIR